MSERILLVRDYERKALTVSARLRRGWQTTFCDVADLSEAGCKLKAAVNFIDVGHRVFVQPDGLEKLTGIVRWKNGDWMGVEFDRAVYRPVVDHLVKTSSARKNANLGT